MSKLDIDRIFDDMEIKDDNIRKEHDIRDLIKKMEDEKKERKQKESSVRYDEIDANCVVCQEKLVEKYVPRHDINCQVPIMDSERIQYTGHIYKCLMCRRCGIIYESVPEIE